MSWEGRQCQIQNPAEPCCRRIFGRSAQRNAQIGLNGYFLSGLLFLQRQSRIFGCGRQRFLCSLNLPGTVVLQSVSAPHPQSPPEISARTGEQRHVIPVFPPLPDKIGFISVKDILCNQLLKALNPYSYGSCHSHMSFKPKITVFLSIIIHTLRITPKKISNVSIIIISAIKEWDELIWRSLAKSTHPAF